MQDAWSKRDQIVAKTIMHGAVWISRVSLLGFVVFIFSGPFDLIQLYWPPMGWQVWDTLLCFLFFVQHSGMIRRGLRARMADQIPAYYHDALYCIVSGVVLAMVVVFWQPSHMLLLELQGAWRWLARGLFFLAAAGMGWGVWALKGFDPYGKKPIQAHLSSRPLRPRPFSVQGPYLRMRHPLYFFTLVMIWSGPLLSADRLLFNVLWSGWIYLGALLEEKDLMSDFGDDYRRYQKQVPMLIPWKIAQKASAEPTPLK